MSSISNHRMYVQISLFAWSYTGTVREVDYGPPSIGQCLLCSKMRKLLHLHRLMHIQAHTHRHTHANKHSHGFTGSERTNWNPGHAGHLNSQSEAAVYPTATYPKEHIPNPLLIRASQRHQTGNHIFSLITNGVDFNTRRDCEHFL